MAANVSSQVMNGSGEGYVVTEFGAHQFGIPILSIEGVVCLERYTPVPLASAYIRGISNMRGRIVTIVDAAGFVGLPGGETSHCVTFRVGGDIYGLLVEGVDRVIEVDRNARLPVPYNVPRQLRSVADGVIRLDEGLAVLLDMERFLENLVPAAGQEALAAAEV